MKHLKLSLIPLGVVLIIGCSMEPDAPKLISPQEGEVFDMIPPTFIWSSEEYAEGYAIIVDETPPDLSDLIGPMPFSDELADTTVTMHQEAFDLLNNTTYYWHVASLWTENGDTSYNWSEWRTFVIKKPEEPQGLDLDTTYFPFGLGYKWCYESNNGGVYDTFTVEVTDSSWIADTLVFQLIGSFYGISNPVEIWDNQVTVFDELIDVVP